MRRIKLPFHMEHWQFISLCLTVYDAVAIAFSYLFALLLRFDFQFSQIPEEYYIGYRKFMPFYIIICLILFRIMRLYRSIWRFASIRELENVFFATLFTVPLNVILTILFVQRMPVSYYIIGGILQFGMILAIRFSYRFVLLERSIRTKKEADATHIMLIGAGQAGQMILRDIHRQKETKERVVCIIDDNRNKWDRLVEGVRVVGGRNSILENVEKYNVQKIYVAIPSASVADKRDILNICKETNCELRSLPGMYQLTTGEVTTSQLQAVSVEDLLGRDVIKVNLDEIADYLRGKVVLVTGGGGSIGSELCRQIASHNPKQLIIFDVYENNAYDIQQELKRKYSSELELIVLIGSVRDSRRIMEVFDRYRPEIVFHAAAHKHVPLMEGSPCEAIKNNVIGTYKTAYAAMRYGVDRFVLISTDKAVNPTNIMGASKRLCEMVIQTMDRIGRDHREPILPVVHSHSDENSVWADSLKMRAGSSHTRFVAVRFGNVLGSNGSVIPLFKKQIAEGGPVTVTHPDITRYFMTIPEAVSLVLQAGAYAGTAKESRVYVLDMGEPVKIDLLARNLIKLSGYEPDVDIKIVYTGLRPGEKLYEEKLMDEEGLQKTPNELIHIGLPIPIDTNAFLTELEQLAKACYENSPETERIVAEMVPTFNHRQ